MPEFVAGFAAAANRLLRVVEGLQVNRERMRRRLRDGTSDLVMAEAAYVLLAASGSVDAHEQMRRLTLECERSGVRLLDAARADQDTWARLERAVQARFATTALDFFSHPERYVGQAAAKARALAARYRGLMDGLERESRSGDA